MEKIVLAAGCFWGTQEFYSRLKGVTATRVGYAQGQMKNPTYKEVKAQISGHAEVCEITYDENVISLKKILDYFMLIIDPTELNHQGEDFGTSYRTGIYTLNESDLVYAEDYLKDRAKDYNKEIVVETEMLDVFYDAEDYHQNYLKVNPTGYCHINFSLIKDEDKK